MCMEKWMVVAKLFGISNTGKGLCTGEHIGASAHSKYIRQSFMFINKALTMTLCGKRI